jgi:hypothetical protein
MANITSLMADIESLMATNQTSYGEYPISYGEYPIAYGEYRSPYGENRIALWRKIFWYGENSLGSINMAEITLRGTLGCLAYHGGGCFFGCFFCCGFCFDLLALSLLVKRKASQPRSREWYFTMQLGCQILVQRLD